jgi:FkbM family methyltransferase
MIKIEYIDNNIKVNTEEISKYNSNTPFVLNIKKHVSKDVQWSCHLNDNWIATYPNIEMFDTEIIDSKGNILFYKEWNLVEHGNYFYKSLWLYNEKLISEGKKPNGLVIGTHDGEFGEWVPVALKNKANITLVEASDKQFNRLSINYKDYDNIKCIQSLVTPNGGEVEFFEGGEGYTNSVVEKVIRDWEIEEIKSTFRESISIVNLIDKHCGGNIDWLHLDVEGLDSELIKSLSYVEDKLPNFIIFEDNNYNEIEKNDIHSWLINLGYCIKSLNGVCEAIK